jgi:hypothetical protein
VSLSVGDEAKGDGPLRNRVGELAPGVDQLVQLEMERPKQRADYSPVKLLTDQGQVDELLQHRR